MFVAYLLVRNIRYEEDLVEQLCIGGDPEDQPGDPGEMVGTTRSRGSFFMNRFSQLGFVDYNGGGLQVDSSLLSVTLHD